MHASVNGAKKSKWNICTDVCVLGRITYRIWLITKLFISFASTFFSVQQLLAATAGAAGAVVVVFNSIVAISFFFIAVCYSLAR